MKSFLTPAASTMKNLYEQIHCLCGKLLLRPGSLSQSPGRLRSLSLLVIALGLSMAGLSQQQVTITGTISDSTSAEPLQGVSVLVEGTTRGTQTNASGMYSIAVAANATLVFRHVGYEQKTATISGQATIDITLSAINKDLDQVVVVAYGRQKKATITGAIASIKTREIKQSPAANLAVTLAGRLPGLTAIQRSGEPGRDVTQLFIRGQGTVNGQAPIILVDGVERDLTYIDPNEIESVTILKDASSTAIFGVRGANGVILITTRRGSGAPSISFSTEASLQEFTRFINPVNSYEYASLRNLAQNNDGLGDAYSAEALEKYRTGSDPLRYPNTNWRDLLIKPYSLQQRYNLNLTGASKTVKYFVNVGYVNQGGQFKVEKDLAYDPSFFLNRYNFRSNIDIQLTKTTKAFLNIAGYLENQNMPRGVIDVTGNDVNTNVGANSPVFWIVGYMNDLPANIPGPLTPSGEVITSSINDNPAYGQINRSGYVKQTRTNITATYGMEQDLDFLTKGLSIKAVMSFDARTVHNFYASRNYERYIQVIDPNLNGADGEDSVYYMQHLPQIQNTPLSTNSSTTYNRLSNFQGYLNYNRTFDKHAVTGLLLYQQQTNIIGAQLPFNLRGLATRLTYGFDNKYFAEFNAGYNGSEQFAKGNRFGFFPAVSGAWVISNEKFFTDNRVLTQLKLRGSYGKVGNDRIGDRRFLYLDDVTFGGGGYSGSLGLGTRIYTNLLKNEKLQWETSKKLNVGVEIGLFNQLNLIVDVFSEKRDNVLRSRGTIPVLNGLPMSTLPPVNIGVIENKGYEIELNYKKAFNSDFSVLSRINLSYARNKQLFADEPLLPETYAYQYRETGYSIGQAFGYIVEGYFADDDDVLNSPVQTVGGHESRPGDFKYKDLNKDNVVDDKDRAPIGYSSVPEYTFGAAFNVNYKRFDLSILFQGVTNVYNYYAGTGTFAGANYVDRHLESWTPERVASGEPINYPRLTTQTSPNEIFNTFFYIDASYLRLKNVEIGYSLPASVGKKIFAKGIRVYANGLNLATWDRLPTNNFDPELNGGQTYPIVRLYNLGVNVTF